MSEEDIHCYFIIIHFQGELWRSSGGPLARRRHRPRPLLHARSRSKVNPVKLGKDRAFNQEPFAARPPPLHSPTPPLHPSLKPRL